MTIKELRKRANLSQEELAKKVGVDRTSISKWETQQALPNASKLPKLATALNCKIDDFFAK